jgi:hypothetical protein
MVIKPEEAGEPEEHMAQVVDLQKHRRHSAAKKGFQGWSRRFSEKFNEDTQLTDLSNPTLAALISGGEDSMMPLYEFIMGVLGLGTGVQFYYLQTSEKMAVMDIAIFLLDRLRFEAMRRLGWLEDDSSFHVPMVDMIQHSQRHVPSPGSLTPFLCAEHPRYGEYEKAFEGDRPAFIRRLIPEAIEAFVKMAHDDM